MPIVLPPERPTLVYDGSCGFCTDCVDVVRRWDRARRFDCVPFQDQAALARYAIPVASYAAAMHLLLPDGRVFLGADAAPEILRRLPRRGWLAWPWRIPGVPRLARRVYAWIAARRRCVLPPPVDAASAGPLGSPP